MRVRRGRRVLPGAAKDSELHVVVEGYRLGGGFDTMAADSYGFRGEHGLATVRAGAWGWRAEPGRIRGTDARADVRTRRLRPDDARKGSQGRRAISSGGVSTPAAARIGSNPLR